MSQRIGVAVHLAIGQLAVPVNHSGSIGRALGLFGEEVGKGLAQVNVNVLACAYFNDTLSILVAHNTDAVDGPVGLGHHVLHRGLDGVGHCSHLLAAVHRQARLHADVVVLACQEDMGEHVVEYVAAVLLHQRTVRLAEVAGLLPAGQCREVERYAGLHTDVTAEVREGVGQLCQRLLHLLVDAGDVFANGLFLLDFHHKRNGAYEHAVSLLHPWVAAPVVDGGIGHLLLAQHACQHIAEGCLEQLVGCEAVLLTPVVHLCATDIGRLLSHFTDWVLRPCRQCCQVDTGIFLRHHRLGALVLFIAQTSRFVLSSIQYAIFLWRQGLALVGQWQVALREEHQIACAVGNEVMDVQQHIAFPFRRGNQFYA